MVNVGKGKGIATYFKAGVFEHVKDVKELNMQITKFTSSDIDTINVYRSSNGNSLSLFNYLVEMINKEKPTLITGDFNICFLTHSGNRMSKGLRTMGFSQLVGEATPLRGGHIEHAHWRHDNEVWKDPELELYSPYYSDHDALCITLIKK